MARDHNMRRWSPLASFTFLLIALHDKIHGATAWAPINAQPCRNRFSLGASSPSQTCLHVTPSTILDSFPLMDQLSSVDSSAHLNLINPADVMASSPASTTLELQASVLKELSRVILDVLTLVAPTTMFLRLALVSGRVFGMEAEFLEEHEINMDNLLFDIPLLCLYAYLFSRSIYPILRSFFTKHTELDDLVFEQLFQPVGVSWVQYRTMLAADCIDWITVSPGTVLIDENDTGDHPEVDFLYWVYEGDYIVSHNGSEIYKINRTTGKSIDDPSAVGFNGDMRFLYNLDRKKRKEKQQRNGTKETTVTQDEEKEEKKYPMASTTIGERGATLMRLNSVILFDLMDDDEQLAASIRELLLKSLQRKVGTLLVTREQASDQATPVEKDSAAGRDEILHNVQP